MKQQLSWHFYVVLLFVISIAITVFSYFIKHTEYTYEMADLQAMNNAISAAKMEWKDQLPEEPMEYYYDAKTYGLVSIGQSTPDPCGFGTTKFGGATRDFLRTTGIDFSNYSESESYEGKLPHVVVDKEDGELLITVDWVEV